MPLEDSKKTWRIGWGTTTEWPDLLRGSGPSSLPSERSVVLLASRPSLGHHFLLYLALPASARLEMSLCLPTDTLVVLVVAVLLLPDLAGPFGIPLVVVNLPLIVWVDLLVDPLAVAT